MLSSADLPNDIAALKALLLAQDEVVEGLREQLSGIATALFLLAFILFGSTWIERIPLAALIGVMFVVCQKTFEWGSFRLFGKVPKSDIIVGLLVAGFTVLFDLAIALIAGVIVSALVFAWEHAKHIKVNSYVNDKGWKVCELDGSLFFASAAEFQTLFSPADDPQDVVVEFRRARVVDHSAIEAIDALAERYKAAGSRLHLRHLRPDCLDVLEKAKCMVEINVLEDPDYRVADDKLA